MSDGGRYDGEGASGFLRCSDRVAGLILVLLALLYGLQAQAFRVGFVADPVGPRAFPYLLAAALGILGVVLMARPEGKPDWPPARVWGQLLAALASLLGYAWLLVPLGFVPATTLEVFLLCLLFGGAPLQSLGAAAALSIAVYGLFDYALGLPLPLGPFS